MNTILDKEHADFARAMLSPTRTCVAQGKVYVHHYTDCSTSYGITTESMQAIEQYDHGTIKAIMAMHSRSSVVHILCNNARIYILSQR